MDLGGPPPHLPPVSASPLQGPPPPAPHVNPAFFAPPPTHAQAPLPVVSLIEASLVFLWKQENYSYYNNYRQIVDPEKSFFFFNIFKD